MYKDPIVEEVRKVREDLADAKRELREIELIEKE